MLLKTCIEKLMHGQHLPGVLCQQVLHDVLTQPINPLQVAAFLVLLRAKPETAEELAAIVTFLREKMLNIPTSHTVLDIVGTGGDGYRTINISTGSAILAASCGIKIAKHGNRAVSSLAGSADVLERLGIEINLSPEKIAACIDEVGIGFCFAPNFHPLTQQLRLLRKELNVPTTFNLLGPLLNPAHAAHIVLGVLDEKLLPVMADVLLQMGSDRSVVVHGNGLDEISCVGPTKILEVTPEGITSYTLDPSDYGFTLCKLTDLQGGDAQHNAELLLKTFKGKRGAIADTLILNAAIALYIYGSYSSVAESVRHASACLYNGTALTLLNKWIEFSHDK